MDYAAQVALYSKIAEEKGLVIGGAPDIGCYEFDPKELLGMQVIFR